MRARLRSQPTLSRATQTRRSAPHLPRPRQMAEEPTAPEQFSGPDEERVRRSGGPQDAALYTCRCGCSFRAAVSASVGCPHCGEQQTW